MRHTIVTMEHGRPEARLEAGHDHEVAADGTDVLMRRLVLAGTVALVATGCGGGGGSSASARRHCDAASKTAKAGSLEADFARLGPGPLRGAAAASSTARTAGQLKMTLDARSADPVRHGGRGRRVYLRSPAFAQATTRTSSGSSSTWPRLGARRANTDLSGILDASPTTANALAYLQGASTSRRSARRLIGGVDTTHYEVSANLDRAAEHASGARATRSGRDRAERGADASPRRLARRRTATFAR